MSEASKSPPDKKTSPDDVEYDSPWKPLAWILIPFALVLLYGFFGPR